MTPTNVNVSAGGKFHVNSAATRIDNLGLLLQDKKREGSGAQAFSLGYSAYGKYGAAARVCPKRHARLSALLR